MGAVGGFAGSPIAQQEATVSGSALGWAFMNALNASLGTYCTLGVNVADFTRYARTPKAQYVQLIIIPVVFIIVSFFGIATTSASKVLYGSYLWNPADIFAQWGNRGAVFFCLGGICSEYHRHQYFCQFNFCGSRFDDPVSEIHQSPSWANSGGVYRRMGVCPLEHSR